MTLPFALSIHNFVNSVGAYVGFGSILAVALLVLLYFAHARETATLRERLDEAQQRIGGLEARIAQLMQMQAAVPRGRPGGPPVGAPPGVPARVTPPPVPVRGGGAQIPSVRRVPSPVTAAAGAAAAPAAARGANGSTGLSPLLPAAPLGVAAPALASATKLVPDPAVHAGEPDDTMFVPAAAAAAANGQAAEQTAVLAAPAPSVAAAARIPSATPRGAVAAPPRVQIGAEQGAVAAANGGAAAAGGGRSVRRIGGGPQAPAPVGSLLDETEQGGRFSGRLLPLVIGAIAIAVIIAGLIVIKTNSGSSTTGQVAHNNTGLTGASLNQRHHKPTFKASHVTVAVLNGTAQAGLAGYVGSKLAHDGYHRGNITNAASQTQGLTFVYYMPGKARLSNELAAKHVARALRLKLSRVRPAGHGVIQSCTISPSGAALGACGADVIVSVGRDLATG